MSRRSATTLAAPRRLSAVVLVAVLALLGAACNPVVDPWAGMAPATFHAHASVGQVWVVDATPGATLNLLDTKGHLAAPPQVADAKGSMIFRGVFGGSEVRVQQVLDGQASVSGPLRVMTTASAPPDPSVYDQTLPVGGWAGQEKAGYGYLTTRDGTELSIMVRLPGPPDKGPYPTVIEYSGYDPSNPDSPQPMTELSGLFGYATVGVNIRGTGCSGGAFDYFEPLQSLDGYDVVETVARQPWVLNHKPGMVGISYPGISQLFVGATEPPSLAAIAPLSVIDNTATTLYPGGILNDGFALSWGQDRANQAKEGGQKWAAKRIADGDQECIANQKLRLQTPDLIAKLLANTHYDPAVADPLNPVTFVNKIKVPTFLACQWQDEQTGGHCAALVTHFTGTDQKWFTFTNGTHFDSLDPATFTRMLDFLELFVARRKPTTGPTFKVLSPFIYQQAIGVSGVAAPDDPIADAPDYASAMALFEAQPRVRVRFDNGGSAQPGYPVSTFEQGFDSFPVPSQQPQAWYFGPGGSLNPAPPADAGGADQYQADASVREVTSFGGSTSDIWAALPAWTWQPAAAGTSVSYETAPLASDEVLAGFGSVDLWLRSTATDTDLQATLTEIRPDGKEELVQSGWLRASDRALDPSSTELQPVHPGTWAAVEPMPVGQATLVRIDLYPFAHAVRAGSRLRITVSSPGRDRPFWTFAAPPVAGAVTNAVFRTPALPSRIVLPVVPGASIPTPLPTCTLRGQPCRDAAPIVDTPAG